MDLRLLSAGFALLVATMGVARAQDPASPAAVTAPVPALQGPTSQPDREIQVATDAFVKDAKLPAWVQPHAVPESRTTGPAVLQLVDSQIMVADQPVTYTRRAMRVNDALVLSQIGRVPINFIPAYQRVVLHALQVVRNGEVLDRLPAAQIRFLQRETGLENNVYSGVVTASILVDDLRVGDTLEFAFSTIGANPVFGPTWTGIESWEQALPIEARRVIVNAPVARRIAWKSHGDLVKKFPSPVERTQNGIRSLAFEEVGLVGVPPETSVPGGFATYRWLEFSEYADWNGVATWAASLFDDREPPSAERIALVAGMKTRATPEERVVAALEFVQSQVRYFSVSLGTSSHRPTAPNTVLTRRYGDCKDKSLLLVALLKDMGIASTPVLARLGNRTGFDDWLPTPLAFDHVIVEVDLDDAGKRSRWFLDSTRLGQHGRLARMGQVHDGSQVLVASPATTALHRIDAPNRDELALDERSETMKIAKLDGDAELTVIQTQQGVGAEAARVILGALPKDRIDTIFATEMEKRYAGAKLLEPVKFDDDRIDNRFSATMRFSVPKPAQHQGNAWRVAFRPDNFARIFPIAQDSKRRAPVAVRYPVNIHYTFEALFPEEVSATVDPLVATVDNRYFVASAEHSFRGNRALSSATMRTRTDRVVASDVGFLRDELMKFERGFPTAIAFADTSIKQPTFLGLGRKDFPATLKSRQDDAVRRITATIDSNRLSGGDLAQAYCDRGVALYSLGRNDEAMADGDRAVDIDPNVPKTLVCRAEIRLATGDFTRAIADASRAIVLGFEGAAPYHERGQAKFHLGRYREAAEDFAKARAVDSGERSATYNDLWRALAFRRMKQPLPDDLQKRATVEARGAWPRPALALLADRLSPEDMHTLASSRPGDEAEMNGTEADFYLGEYWLSLGETGKARDAFKASRARGVIIYSEYLASGFELDRLAK